MGEKLSVRPLSEAIFHTELNTLHAKLQRFGVEFDDLKRALTRESYFDQFASGKREHMERYEYLGDRDIREAVSFLQSARAKKVAILEQGYGERDDSETALMASFLDVERTPSLDMRDQGVLQRNAVFSRAALRLGLDRTLRLSVSEARSIPTKQLKILADAFEAVAHAVYLAQDYDDNDRRVRRVAEFVDEYLIPVFVEVKDLFDRDPSVRRRFLANLPIDTAASAANASGVSTEKDLSVFVKGNPWVVWGLGGPASIFFPLAEDAHVSPVATSTAMPRLDAAHSLDLFPIIPPDPSLRPLEQYGNEHDPMGRWRRYLTCIAPRYGVNISKMVRIYAGSNDDGTNTVAVYADKHRIGVMKAPSVDVGVCDILRAAGIPADIERSRTFVESELGEKYPVLRAFPRGFLHDGAHAFQVRGDTQPLVDAFRSELMQQFGSEVSSQIYLRKRKGQKHLILYVDQRSICRSSYEGDPNRIIEELLDNARKRLNM